MLNVRRLSFSKETCMIVADGAARRASEPPGWTICSGG
jgi:hypothetical protein